jgi:hypothetical protein
MYGVMSTHLRVISTRLPVADPIGLHTDSSHGIVLRELREKYAGRCYQQCMILEIGRIIMLTAAEIGYASNTGEGIVEVQFEATVLQPTVGDTLCGCLVRAKTEDLMYAVVQYGGVDRGYITIPVNDRVRSISIGQRIIVAVDHVLFGEFSQVFTAIGSLYTPPRRALVYECGDYELSTHAEELAETLSTLRAAVIARPGYQRILAALYGWKTPQSPPPGAKSVDLPAFVTKNTASRPQFVAQDSRAPAGTVYTYEKALFPGDYVLMPGVQTETLMITLLQTAIAELHALQSACEYYGSDDEYKRHENMWRVIAADKQ